MMVNRIDSNPNQEAREPAGAGRLWEQGLAPSTRGGIQATVQVVLSAALFALLQVLAGAHNLRFDLTPGQHFVLSDAARQVAAGLQQEVLLTIFFNSQESGQLRDSEDLLGQFRSASRRIGYRFVDLDRTPGLAQEYGVSSYNTGVAESGGRVIALKTVDEQEVTRALLKLSRSTTPQVCFLTGHGERSPESSDSREGYSEVAKALERENFTVRTFETVPMDGVPDPCRVTIVAGPSHELLPGEAQLLESYLRDGGQLMVLVDRDAPRSVTEMLRSLGVEARDELIVDEQNRFLGADSFAARVHPVDEQRFGDRLPAAVFPLARSLRPVDDAPPDGMQVTVLAMSSEGSWALVGASGKLPRNEAVRFRSEIDRPGPLPVGVLVAKTAQSDQGGGRQGRLVVFGDSDFATNFYLNILGNKDLFLSTVALLAEEPELIAVRSKGRTGGTLSPIALTAQQGRAVFWVAVVVQPLVFVLAGLIAVAVRSRRRGGR